MPVHEGLYTETATAFQSAGYTVLLYDNRGVGTSDGQPRGESDPAKQTSDLHAAVSFLKRSFSTVVDPTRIALWGYSFSAACALAAAGLDKRIKAVVAVCPAVPFDVDDAEKRNRFLSLAMRDMESRARGNPPLCMPLIGLGGDEDGAIYDYRLFRGTEGMSVDEAVGMFERIPGFSTQIPIGAFYHMVAWPFEGLLGFVAPTPVLMVTAENEELEYVKRKYGVIYERLTGPKEWHVVRDRGHMDVLNVDEGFEETVRVQLAFLAKYLM